MLELGSFAYRRRWAIVVAWLVVLAASLGYIALVGGALTGEQQMPGSESVRAGEQIRQTFGIPDAPPVQVVLRSPQPLAGERPAVEAVVERLAAAFPGQAVESPLEPGTGQAALSPDGRVGVVNLRFATFTEAERAVPAVRRAAGERAGRSVEVLTTGDPALQHDLQPLLDEDLRRAELIALPAALVVLLLVLGTFVAALVPFALALVSLPPVLTLVYVVSRFTDVSVYATNVVTMIGLGLVIDYSLLVVYRFREEIAGGRAVEEATRRTAATALRAVVFSGVAVAIGLAVLLLVPVPFIRSMGVAGVLIPGIAIPAAATFLPALLAIIGPRINRGRVVPRRILDAEESGLWRRVASVIMRAPGLFLVAGSLLILLVAAPVRDLGMGASPVSALPGEGEAVRGAQTLDRAFAGGTATPLRVVVDRPPAALAAVPARLAATPGVVDARIVAARGDRTVIQILGAGGLGTPQAGELVQELRERALPAALPRGATALVGGGPAIFADFEEALYGHFVLLVLGVVAMTYVVLFRAFRSLLLPLKAVVMNLLSVAGAYGLLVLVFQHGVGADLLGFHTADQIAVWIPMFLFAFLFGLSMDYEVFLLARMREEYDRIGDRPGANEQAVATGLAKTGKIITSAAVIMVLAFGGLATGRVIEMQQFGFGLAAAILLDVTVIRTLVVPSLMKLMGAWNWWLPARLVPLAGRGLQHELADERP